jgi:hypothetical protein
MKWENNRWVTTTFNLSAPFVLMSDGNGSLTKESVAKAFDGVSTYADQVTCQPDLYGTRSATCINSTGSTLFFMAEAGKGAISRMYGSTATGGNRDTVSVDTFECTKG